MIDSEQMNDLQLEDVEDYSADYPPVGGEANMAPMATADEMTGNKSPKYRRSAIQAMVRNNKWSIGVLAVVVIVLIGVMAAAVGKDEASSASGIGAEPGVPPKTVDVSGINQDVLANFKTTLEGVFDRHSLDKTLLQEDAGLTPQRHAMLWMATDKNVNSMDHTEQMQRYTLAALHYATNQVSHDYAKDPLPWLKADNWMTNAHSCDWMGIECNEDKVIVSIDLERNRLSGKLPADLAIIGSHLETLDLTSNLLANHGKGEFGMFETFTSLKTLLLDDNYFKQTAYALPEAFGAMKNLQKMRLSYNLFAGKLETGNKPVLANMLKLTHLEIESNFLTGSIPSAITQLSSLVYLYLRRNDMSMTLDFLKTAQMPDLCKFFFSFFLKKYFRKKQLHSLLSLFLVCCFVYSRNVVGQ